MSEGRINVTFRLPVTTARRLKVLAASCGVPRVAVVMAAVRRFYVEQFNSAELPTVEEENRLCEEAGLSVRKDPSPDSPARVAFQRARHRRFVAAGPGNFVRVVKEPVEEEVVSEEEEAAP